MGFIGVQPTSAPLTASDITDGIVSNAKLGADSVNATKIADDSISEEHIDNTAITGFGALTSLADTDKFLVSDASDSNNLKYVEKQYLGGGGDLIHLGTVSTSNSNVSALTIDNCFSSTYDMYRIVGFHNLTSNGAHQYFRWRTGGASGSSYTTANYQWLNRGHYIMTNNNAGEYINKNGGSDHARVGSDAKRDGNTDFCAFDLLVSAPTTNFLPRCYVTGTSAIRQSTDSRFVAHYLAWRNTDNVNATGFQMTVSTGNIDYGKVSVYGFKET